MISIGRVGAADAATYYLDRQAGCELDYYTGAGEPRGRWLGDGTAAVGLSGDLTDGDEELLKSLLAGCGPEGARLVAPVLRADPRSRLPAEPLLRAIESAGHPPLERGLAKPVEVAARRLAAGESSLLDVAVVRRVSDALGVDPVALYCGSDGTDRYAGAAAHAGEQVDIRRAGLDVTVSAPKSVSVLYALGDPAVAAAARAAHEVAVGEVIAYLQRHAATAARGHQGDGQRADRIGTSGLIVAAFDHRSSRAGDPQLHTHLVIPNLVQGIDGRWSAMDTAAIYRYSRTASSLYQAVLRGELTRTLGVGWTPVTKGIAEIVGIPRPVIDGFSQRRRQIVAAMTGHGTSGPKAAQAACLDTRPAKPRTSQVALRERWADIAKTIGFPATRVRSLVGQARLTGAVDVDRLAAELFGPDGVTADRTTFTRQELTRAICDTVPAGTPLKLADVDRLVLTLIGTDEVIPVATREGCERRYTTRELLLVEHAALAAATAEPARPVGVASSMVRDGRLAFADLSDEQVAMVTELTSSGRRVDVVAGPAGSGKTAALAEAHNIWTVSGHPVLGACVSWLAAEQLEAATGIPTVSLTKLVHDADRHGLPPGAIVVLDEASLVNTRTYHRLQQHVIAVDGKLTLIGDPHQLPEIGAGGLFAALAERPEAIRLSGNQRQHEPWERDALRRLRDGDPVTALDAYSAHGRVHTAPTRADLLATVARDYVKHTDGDEDVLVLAARRRDVAALNTAIRSELVTTGRLGARELVVASPDGMTAFRAGDRILVTVNDRRAGLVNGARGTVAVVHPRSGRLELALDSGATVRLDRTMLTNGELTYGYAATVHKAQGLTVDTTLVYGLGPITKEHGYVALSRGRVANHLYLAEDLDSPIDCGPPRASSDRRTRTLTSELIERLRDSRRQELARRQRSDDPWRTLQRYSRDQDRGFGRSR
ncbi:MAG TPA: MobF family relaxase [Mycobacteriales bacterium]|nr:MobF family relaxase [Mycobacteriales bacterium]